MQKLALLLLLLLLKSLIEVDRPQPTQIEKGIKKIKKVFTLRM